MSEQPVYKVGEKYIRIRETGSVYPVHAEQLKMVRKELADVVIWNGKEFTKVDMPSEASSEPAKVISTPARKPEPATPPPMVQRTFAPPTTAAPVVPSLDLSVPTPE